MILALFLTFFQAADSVKIPHTHLSGIDSVQSIYTLSFSADQFSDSSRNFYNVFDITDIQSKISGGLHYQGYGIGIPSSTIQDGVLPNNQSFILNGYEWNDPVSGSLHPATFLTSVLSSVKNENSVSGGKAENWVLGYDFNAYNTPQTVIHYLDGYEKHSSVEGVFTTRITNNWSTRAAIGRKTFEGFGQRNNGSAPELTGTSDQWLFFAQAKRLMSDSLSSLNFMLMTSNHSYGNYGGINDSLTESGELSRTDFRQTPMMYPNSAVKKTSSLFQTWYDAKFNFADLNVSNKTVLTTSKLSSSVSFPISSFDSTASAIKYEVSNYQIFNESAASLWGNNLSVGLGSDFVNITNSTLFSSFSRQKFFASGKISSENRFGTISGGVYFSLDDKSYSNSKYFAEIINDINSDLSLKVSGTISETKLNAFEAYRISNSPESSSKENSTVYTAIVQYQKENYFIKSGLTGTQINSPNKIFTNGRVLNDSLISFSTYGKEQKFLQLNVQFMTRNHIADWLGDIETEGKYTYELKSEFLPKHDIVLSLSNHDLWFDRAMNLWLGAEGHYRSSGARIFPDSRYDGLLVDLNRSSKLVKRVDLFARGQVSDMMFRFIWENFTNEANEYYDGYPEAISAIHFEVTWWLWN